MRIMLLSQFFPPDIGGEERHVLNLSTQLAGRGHDVVVATQTVEELPAQEVLPSGVRVRRFPTAAMKIPGVYSSGRRHHLPMPDPLAVRELARIMREERPDVVHAHNWIVNSAVALQSAAADKALRVPRHGLVLTLHDYSQVCATKRMMRDARVCPGPAPQRCLPCASAHYGPVVGSVTAAATAAMRPWKGQAIDHIACVSRSVLQRNGLTGRPRTSVIPNFIPDALVENGRTSPPELPPEVAQLPDGEYVIFVGDLSGEKGVGVLLEAYQRLPQPRPELVLIGRRGKDTPDVLPEGARILVEWRHEAVLEAFRRSAFAVLPSVWPDPCPTTVLESMACGRPVVTTAIGGMLDMVVPEESGLLVKPGDAVELHAAMRRLVENPQLRDRLGRAGVARAGHFTASSVAERLERVYESVIPHGVDGAVLGVA